MGHAADAAAAEAPGASPWRFEGVYKADLLRAERPRVATAVGHLDIALSVDAGVLLGGVATKLRIEAISDQGGKPNRAIGTLGGISNLEVARSSARLYSAWLARDFAPELNVLAGLYDLNSEFYSTDASALLIHPAFGIGTALAQTGANGPSIFPNLSAGVRVRATRESRWYAQAAVLDGVPGDPAQPGRTVVHWRHGDGVLAVAEAGRQESESPRHWGIVVWAYSARAPLLDGTGAGRNRGFYAIAQELVAGAPRTTGFVRAGRTDGRINAVATALEAGALIEKPWGDAGPVAATAGLAMAWLGAAQRARLARSGVATKPYEASFEIGARWTPGAGFAVQPLVQRVRHAGGVRGACSTIVGARLEWRPMSP